MEKIITIIGNKEKKMRVHTLAKEYGIKATEFVDIIQNFGVDITSHLNALDGDQIEHIKKSMLKESFEEDQPKEIIDNENVDEKPKQEIKIEQSLFVKFLNWIRGNE